MEFCDPLTFAAVIKEITTSIDRSSHGTYFDETVFSLLHHRRLPTVRYHLYHLLSSHFFSIKLFVGQNHFLSVASDAYFSFFNLSIHRLMGIRKIMISGAL